MKLRMLLLTLLAAPALVGQTYTLEPLANHATKHVAPSLIQTAMGEFEKERLAQCSDEREITQKQFRRYFSSIRVRFSNNKLDQCYLVFPSRYCTAFFGAHGISFWLVMKRPNKPISLLHKGFGDAISVLPTHTKGMRDIEVIYGASSNNFRFQGELYKATKE